MTISNERIEVEQERLMLAYEQFASRMKLKLLEKLAEGWSGWDNVNAFADSTLEARLKGAVRLKKWVNVANFAMFMWDREWRRDHANKP